MAEWQTRGTKDPPGEIPWGFKSLCRHHFWILGHGRVAQRQRQWFQKPPSGGSNPPASTIARRGRMCYDTAHGPERADTERAVVPAGGGVRGLVHDEARAVRPVHGLGRGVGDQAGQGEDPAGRGVQDGGEIDVLRRPRTGGGPGVRGVRRGERGVCRQASRGHGRGVPEGGEKDNAGERRKR